MELLLEIGSFIASTLVIIFGLAALTVMITGELTFGAFLLTILILVGT